MKPVPDKPVSFHKRVSLEDQLAALPPGMYSANRYDTDDESKIHLWNDQGRSYDLTIPKRLPLPKGTIL
jgi:hypothetical protein